MTITGTATDAGGGMVGGVEVSTDGGATWRPADGTTSWTYTWTAAGSGTVTIKSRAFDDSGNIETPGAGVSMTVTASRTCPCTIWASTAVPPAPVDSGDPASVELGMQFRTDVAGYISGVRFYKASLNTGTHTGSLWTSTGVLLGSVTFSGETASGWQQATFTNAIAVTANTTYVVSYHAPNGHYTGTDAFFAAAVDNAPLHALRDGADGANGVYAYGTSTAFPSSTYNSENYWVDVVFTTSRPVDTTPPTVTTVSPTANATAVPVSSGVNATFSEVMDAASITTSTFVLRSGATTVPATVTSAGGTATLTPNAPLAGGATFTATVQGGSLGVKDAAGNPLSSDVSWSFTTTAPPACPCSLWTLTTTPGPNSSDAGAVELGMKFQADTDGFITGLRFYKYAQNTGTHTGSLWSTAGTLLGTLTFTGESASGWQEAAFASPIAVTAATTYVASYHTNSGFYAASSNGFTAGVDRAPLHALSDAAGGGNGVYRYGAASAFPNQTYQGSNYWVDVTFATSRPVDTTPPTVTAVNPSANATGVPVSSGVSATFSEVMDAASITSSTFVLRSGATTVPATVTSAGGTATLSPNAPLAGGATFTATVQGGNLGVKDAAGNPLASDVSWSFTTTVPPACPCSLWTLTTTPGPNSSDAGAVELGMKFQTDTDGFITGLRFYKYAQNTGTHTGSLWSAAGTLLGTLTFTGESASGWQAATFASPIAVAAATTYIASYHTNTGFYAASSNGFTVGVDKAPLHALSSAAAGGSGVYRYGASSAFPTETYQATNYWVDVIYGYTTVPDRTPPAIASTNPAPGGAGVPIGRTVQASFSEAMDPATVSSATVVLQRGSTLMPAAVSYSSGVASLTPSAPLANATTYSALIKGGPSGVKDRAGNELPADYAWTFTTAPAPVAPTAGAGGPILIVTSAGNPFTAYYAEILRSEGLNEFSVVEQSAVTDSLLADFDVIILGEQSLTTAQVSMLTSWVAAGGNLIAMRPDKKLSTLLGLSDGGGVLSNGYLAIDSSKAPGAGLVAETIQYHGTADRYVPVEASVVATLYSDAAHASPYPAVTLKPASGPSGSAAAFTYDLARSIVYTRQGNPGWSAQERDGFDPVRSDDLFFGGKAGDIQPDWVDLSKVAIPQADEQQRLLANLIGLVNQVRRPLPRLWYLPRGLKAAVVMTGDDHGNNGTAGRFDIYNSNSTAGCQVDNWECIRATSYIFTNTPISASDVATYVSQGFEVGAHLWMSGLTQGGDTPSSPCNNFTAASIAADYPKQLSLFASLFPAASPVRTNRTHCIVWSDFSTQASVAQANGIRLDTNYYYWPSSWVGDRPGVFTGSGLPMRLAQANGTMIDVYQAATQMTDESGQSYPKHVNTLLDNALGANGYYGAFVANMHTDTAVHAESAAIVASAKARGVPVVSAGQMLTWIDGRNSTAFGPITWANNVLNFNVVPGTGSNGLQVMIPVAAGALRLSAVTLDGQVIIPTVQTIKGVEYAFVTARVGLYAATYQP